MVPCETRVTGNISIIFQNIIFFLIAKALKIKWGMSVSADLNILSDAGNTFCVRVIF